MCSFRHSMILGFGSVALVTSITAAPSAQQPPRAEGVVPSTVVPAQDPRGVNLTGVRNYYEQKRRDQIARQLYLIDDVRLLNGLPPRAWYPTIGQGVGGAGGTTAVPAGPQPRAGSIPSPGITAARSPAWTARPAIYWGVFEPWSLVSGDIYGYIYDNPAAQPRGHSITSDGKGGYVYRPVYEGETVDPLAGASPAGPYAPADAAGIDAFEQFFALAAETFQAQGYHNVLQQLDRIQAETGRTDARSEFLRGQAYVALGQYREAAVAIVHGLELSPRDQWGMFVRDFRDFYPDWRIYIQQLQRLEDHVRKHPSDSTAQFVLGYQYGFLGYPLEAALQLDLATGGGMNHPAVIDLFEQFTEQALSRAEQNRQSESDAAETPAPQEFERPDTRREF